MGLPPTAQSDSTDQVAIACQPWVCFRCSSGQTTIFHTGDSCPNEPPAAVVTCPHCGEDVALEVK